MKNTMKKVIMVVLAFTIFASTICTVNAVPQSIKLGSAESLKGYVAGFGFSTKKTTSGEYLYCLNYHKSTAKNITANLVGQRDAGLAAIIQNGYPNKSITGDKWKDYYITQVAVWWYLDNTTGSSNLKSSVKSTGSDSYNLRSKIKNLVAIGEKAKKNGYPTTKLDISASSTEMTLSNGYYTTGDIKAKTISNISSYKVELTDAPSGAEIVNSNGKVISTVSGTNTFKVRIPASKVTSTELKLTVKATGTGTVAKAYEYQPTNKNMQNVTPSILETEKITKSDSITFNLSTTKVTIVKVDSATQQPLAGATLVLKDANGNKITEWVSTTNGHVIRNLSNGTYKLEEVAAPQGYKLNKEAVTFTINDSNKDVKVTFENEAKEVVVNILKVDASTGEALEGAVLVLTKPNGEQIKIVTTKEAYVITGLEDGTYKLHEEVAPNGYIKSDKVITFTIDDENLSHQITFENAPEVEVPDTASSSIIFSLIGMVIISLGLGFIYKNGQKA